MATLPAGVNLLRRPFSFHKYRFDKIFQDIADANEIVEELQITDDEAPGEFEYLLGSTNLTPI